MVCTSLEIHNIGFILMQLLLSSKLYATVVVDVKFCHRVLDLAKTAPQEAVTDEVSLLLAIKV